MILKLPKKRGTGFINKPKKFGAPVVAVNLRDIERSFSSGEMVTVKTLVKKGIVSAAFRAKTSVKILGTGSLRKKLNFVGVSVSEAARRTIEAAGGTVR